jgi:hypothetical protein
MEFTYEMISKWFEVYFDAVRKNQGDLKTVPNLKRFFAPDLQLTMHTAPSQAVVAMSRDALLISFVHPGLQEDIFPRCYVIDTRQMVVAVQFELQFRDEPSGKKWPPLQASAHYHLTADGTGNLQISKIEYWTEALPNDLFDIWAQRRTEAFTGHALAFINAQAPGGRAALDRPSPH